MANLLAATAGPAHNTTPRRPGQLKMELELSARVIHHAKTIAAESVCLWGFDDLAHSVALALAELLTNVMRHVPPVPGTGGRVSGRCLVQRVPGGVVVVVHDDDPTPPCDPCGDPDSVSGRGLVLVRALAAAFTVTPGPSGKDITALFLAQGEPQGGAR